MENDPVGTPPIVEFFTLFLRVPLAIKKCKLKKLSVGCCPKFSLLTWVLILLWIVPGWIPTQDLWQLEWSVHRDPRRLPGIRAFLAADSSWKIWWSKMSDVTLINIPRVHQNENYIFPNIILCPSYPSDQIKYSILTAPTQLVGSFLIGTTFWPDFWFLCTRAWNKVHTKVRNHGESP